MIEHLHTVPGDPASPARLAEAITEYGAVTFDGPADRAELLNLAASLMRVRRHRDSDDDAITTLVDRGEVAKKAGYAGFGNERLQLHTEASGIELPPGLMMLFCTSAAVQGGECLLADGAMVAETLAVQDPELWELVCRPRSAMFGGSTGYLGAILTATGKRTTIRLRLDALAQFTPELAKRLPALRRIVADCAEAVALPAGRGYLLSNTRFLHGRAAFDGRREMWRLLGDALPQHSVPTGFPAVMAHGSVR